LSVLGVLLVVVLGAWLISTFSLIIACLVKTRERFMGVGQVLTMPLFFASSAIYPPAMMPAWLKAVARGNPLTYDVDTLRAVMLVDAVSEFGLAVDLLVLGGTASILTLIGAWLYPRLAQ
jgi:ABC-2 type transport system permease protein